MRIAIFTDVHGNLPALEAALTAIERAGCDAVYHTGDAIAIGPYPAECLDRLLHTPRIHCVMGNHDAWFAFGLPQPQPPWMSDGEVIHQRWVHAMLDPALRAVVGAWPYAIEEEWAGSRCVFVHYGLTASGRDFAPVIPKPSPAALDALFVPHHGALVFYGHDHAASDLQGRGRYINPGSLGCFTAPLARFVILALGSQGAHTLTHHSVPCDDAALLRAFAERDVPEREFIQRVFFSR
jgi:predicted phosphodiesterase